MRKRPDFSPDRPLSAEQLASLRHRFGSMSITALYEPTTRRGCGCKVERDGQAPRAEKIQELVQVWKELRKVGKGG